jgi:threonine synthase
MSVDSDVLGEGWEHTVDMKSRSFENNQEEGLLAALNNVSVDKFPRIAIVDDAPDVRRLIRRILQSQGNYLLFEAEDGKSAIELIQKEHPNLVILDLMMPDIDGFSVMDALQSRQDTKDIPIIVVTAKELTSAEKNRLKGHIQSLMQKGDFLSDDLLDEVRALVK